MLTSDFCVCQLWVLPLKGDVWWNVKTHKLISVMTELKNMLICCAIFHCELFPWFIFLAKCEIFNIVDVGRHSHTASLRGWPLARYQSNGLILSDMSIFSFFYLKVSFHRYSVLCPLSGNISCTNLRLHNSCWLTNIYQCLSSTVKPII